MRSGLCHKKNKRSFIYSNNIIRLTSNACHINRIMNLHFKNMKKLVSFLRFYKYPSQSYPNHIYSLNQLIKMKGSNNYQHLIMTQEGFIIYSNEQLFSTAFLTMGEEEGLILYLSLIHI